MNDIFELLQSLCRWPQHVSNQFKYNNYNALPKKKIELTQTLIMFIIFAKFSDELVKRQNFFNFTINEINLMWKYIPSQFQTILVASVNIAIYFLNSFQYRELNLVIMNYRLMNATSFVNNLEIIKQTLTKHKYAWKLILH